MTSSLLLSILIASVWVSFGIIAYGYSLAYWQRGWPSVAKRSYNDDRMISLIIGVLGPIGLFALNIALHGEKFHGFMLQVPKELTMSDFLKPEKRRKRKTGMGMPV